MFDELHSPENIKEIPDPKGKTRKQEAQARILDEFNCYLSEKVEEKERKRSVSNDKSTTKKMPNTSSKELKKQNTPSKTSLAINKKAKIEPESRRTDKSAESSMFQLQKPQQQKTYGFNTPEINPLSKEIKRNVEDLEQWGQYIQHKHEMMRHVLHNILLNNNFYNKV